MLFDGTSPRTRTIELSKAPKGLDAAVTLDGEEVDAFPIDPSTAFPAKGRAGLGPLLPYRPERRTYPLFDSTSGEDVGMDYLGPGSVRGLQVMSVLTRVIAAAAFVAGLVLYARRR